MERVYIDLLNDSEILLFFVIRLLLWNYFICVLIVLVMWYFRKMGCCLRILIFLSFFVILGVKMVVLVFVVSK